MEAVTGMGVTGAVPKEDSSDGGVDGGVNDCSSVESEGDGSDGTRGGVEETGGGVEEVGLVGDDE